MWTPPAADLLVRVLRLSSEAIAREAEYNTSTPHASPVRRSMELVGERPNRPAVRCTRGWPEHTRALAGWVHYRPKPRAQRVQNLSKITTGRGHLDLKNPMMTMMMMMMMLTMVPVMMTMTMTTKAGGSYHSEKRCSQ